MSYSIVSIEETEISASNASGAWVKVRLQESSGSVVILSDYGSWSYFWPPGGRGSRKLPEFLAGLDGHYMGGKLLAMNRLPVDWTNFWERLWVPFVVPALKELSS